MPLVTTTEMFKKAYEGGYAIGAFNVNNMEIVQGITRAAKKLNAPVILQCSAGARKYASHEYLVAMVKAAAEETGLPIADEMLYPSNLSFFDDLLSYHAIGARSVEDQEHRFVASGIDVPIGLKNPTSGNLNVMFNGIYAAQNQQHFLYNGAEVKTDGNPLAHAILRGANNENGQNIVNYHYEDLVKALDKYSAFNLENPFILVDTNHDNSGKNFMEQVRIVREVLLNREWDDRIADTVRGFMIESYLEDGRQDTPEVYGKSITDPCLGWDKTDSLIREIHNRLSL